MSEAVIALGETDPVKVDSAVSFRSADGSLSRIVTRERDCPLCTSTTRITTSTGRSATFTSAHEACIRRALGAPAGTT